MDRESQRADRTVWTDWADADLVAANAEGRVTPAQRAMIIGNSPPVWWPLLIVAGWVLVIAGCVLGVLAANAMDHIDGPGFLGSVFALAFVVICVLLLPAMVMVMGGVLVAEGGKRCEKRREHREHRRWHRRRAAALAAPRIGGALGRIVQVAEQADERREARVGEQPVPVAEGAPPLPPPGPYRLCWLESIRRGAGPLLLSAEPVDSEEAERVTEQGASCSGRTPSARAMPD
ncbi:hypothetical protein FHS35_002095 [Streptomyces umbrinus]|uniref:hypothetical protein n=1 Tax=Streptomyces umbrinus TaxID=67370 RepID=UPI00167DC432|nr:hypothetical protein [Streptomyces umbrinus]MCR3725247.1 hypothetical protein [Streptomyces umbrinus]